MYYMVSAKELRLLANFFFQYVRTLNIMFELPLLGKTQYDNPFDFGDVRPYPDRIRKELRCLLRI